MPRPTFTVLRRLAPLVVALALFVAPTTVAAQSVMEALLLPMDLTVAAGDDIDFGYGIAIDGDTLFVGAPKAGAGSFSDKEGRVYVYERDGVDWLFAQELVAASPDEDNLRFGTALAAEDDVLAVGCVDEVIVFRRVGGAWQQDAEIPLNQGVGASGWLELELEDDVLAVHHVRLFSGDDGGVSVFRELTGGWQLEQFIPLPSGTTTSLGMQLEQGFLMLGAMIASGGGGFEFLDAELSIYEHSGGVWSPGPVLDGGQTLHVSGDLLLTKSYHEVFQFGFPGGHSLSIELRAYALRDGEWVPRSAPDLDDEVFLFKAAMVGDLMMVVGRNGGEGSNTVARLKTYALDESDEWIEQESELISPLIGLPALFQFYQWELVTDGDRAVLADASFGNGFPPDGGAFVFRGTPFGRIESGEFAGTGGAVPQLSGSGTLTPGSDNSLTLSDALPLTTTALLSGLGLEQLPFKGGVLVPTPDLLLNALLALPVNAQGEQALSFAWPADVPTGTKLYLQHWVADPAGPFGFSASNGLELVTQ
ncbi:MAG: hypothetical protein DHS20C15_01330 [Planctomycetota bacterium]|nr:MAG: hypothetical protein DHS20C15_01330 [Planctomycetota bacterium]